MAASLQDIRGWFQKAEAQGYTHMLVVCDTFDHEDYPVYCNSEAEARKRDDKPGDMQRVMEVYKVELGWEAQAEGRSRNF